ncbi:hypothetical protein H058_20365 [Vibrio antiquarius]|nr:hypothetical protein H058_20365 [Vibrio antiquarius]
MGPQLGTLKIHLQFPLVRDKGAHLVLENEPEQRNTEATAYHLNHLNQRIVKMPRVANPS